MDPQKVVWPKSHLKLIRVLHNGLSEGTCCSIADIEWDGKPCYGIRWDNSLTDKGYPHGYWGRPQWLVVNTKMINELKKAVCLVEPLKECGDTPNDQSLVLHSLINREFFFGGLLGILIGLLLDLLLHLFVI